MSDDVLGRLRDAGYTAVGFGVLAVQQAQVRRRELSKELGSTLGGRAAVGRFVRQVEKVVDPVLDGVERRLPKPAGTYFHQARVVSRIVERAVLPR